MGWFVVRLGVTATGGLGLLLYLFSTAGMWLLAAVALYLLVRHRLVFPVTLLTMCVLMDASAETVASVEDSHALSFGAWFAFVGVGLITAGVGIGGRRDPLERVSS
jgi:hypothetical protein